MGLGSLEHGALDPEAFLKGGVAYNKALAVKMSRSSMLLACF